MATANITNLSIEEQNKPVEERISKKPTYQLRIVKVDKQNVDVLLYDIAVLANDWCNADSAGLDHDKVVALLKAYNRYRPFRENEQQYWPAMLRAGALRFWLSRLYDKHFPRPGELVHTKDPDDFRAILKDRVANSEVYHDYWV